MSIETYLKIACCRSVSQMAPKGPSLIFPFPCFIDADVQNSEGHNGRQIMRCR
jgi:hypothetical protein